MSGTDKILPWFWKESDSALTYWLLLIGSRSDERQRALAKELLVWQALEAPDSACVKCIPMSNDPAFLSAAISFEVSSFPTLIFSSTPRFEPALKFTTSLVAAIEESEHGFPNLLATVHMLAMTGKDEKAILKTLRNPERWKKVGSAFETIFPLLTTGLKICGKVASGV